VVENLVEKIKKKLKISNFKKKNLSHICIYDRKWIGFSDQKNHILVAENLVKKLNFFCHIFASKSVGVWGV
jgi:hypothetical protein